MTSADMDGDLLLAIDSSTTACKALAFDAHGQVQAQGRAAIALDNPSADAWEQDANRWWAALGEACHPVVEAVGQRLRALCITQQRETFVLCDGDAKPLAPARVWMDHRGEAEVTRVVDTLGAERVHQLSGKPACTTPTLYKLLDQLRATPELRAARPRVLDVHAYLVWRLSGRFVTSLASADPTGMLDMVGQTWADEILALADLKTSQLPELAAPGEVLGHVTAAAATATGLPQDLPIVAGAGDGQCAGLGAGIDAPGRAYLNLGTAIVSGVLSHDYVVDRAFRTLYAATPGSYFLETDLHGGTFLISWWVDRLLRGAWQAARRDDAPDFETLRAALERDATTLPVGSEGLLLVPYWAGVMNPYWDDHASGILLGLRGSTGAHHIYRAILEGIALEQRKHTRGVEAVAGAIDELIVMGGGSRSDMWCQMMADCLARPIVRAGSTEATALGAAMLAAVASGLHSDYASASGAMTSLGERFEPGPDQPAYATLYEQVYEDLWPTLQERMAKLASLRAHI